VEAAREARRRRQPREPEARHQERMARDVHDGFADLAEQPGERLLEGRDGACPRPRVGAQRRERRVARAVEQRRAPVVEGVRERDGGVEVLDAVRAERQLRERVGQRCVGDHRGAHVVSEPREGELLGARTAAELVGRLEHEHAAPSGGDQGRGGQPVRPRADHDGVVGGGHAASLARAEGQGATPRNAHPRKMTRVD
jgi:hypothetical protein